MKVHEHAVQVLRAVARERMIVPPHSAPTHPGVDLELIWQRPLPDDGRIVQHCLQVELPVALEAVGERGRKNNNGPANAGRSKVRPFLHRGDTKSPRVRLLLQGQRDLRRAEAAALDLAYVACGRLDGFWELGLSPWDMAAGALLIQEAGGLVGDLKGDQTYLTSGDIVAATPKIFPALLEALR